MAGIRSRSQPVRHGGPGSAGGAKEQRAGARPVAKLEPRRGCHGTGLRVCGVLTGQGFLSQAKSFELDPEGKRGLLAV